MVRHLGTRRKKDPLGLVECGERHLVPLAARRKKPPLVQTRAFA